MGNKRRGPSHTQITGIIWITVVLITILAIVFFSREKAPATVTGDTIYTQKVTTLEKKEDSVYRSRERRNRKTGNEEKLRPDSQDFFPSSSHDKVSTRQPLTVELNSADTTTLMLLHGIGPAFARRIVVYRDRLGGFTSTRQLLEVYGFTPELLAHISPYLLLDSDNLRKINVNSMGLKELIKHPYVEYYFARDLVNLRSRGVTFATPDDLRTIPSCTDTMLAKLLPYLAF
ncbi:MAG: helix-hairpin-helix domain-containing protein [bacterium]